MSAPVPEWVHMAEVPPPADDQPESIAVPRRAGWLPVAIVIVLTIAAVAWRIAR